MDQVRNIIKTTIEKIEELTNYFYKQKNKEGFAQLDQLILILMNTLDQLFFYQSENNKIYIDDTKVNNRLSEAMIAIQMKDTILLADILKYDIISLLQEAEQQL